MVVVTVIGIPVILDFCTWHWEKISSCHHLLLKTMLLCLDFVGGIFSSMEKFHVCAWNFQSCCIFSGKWQVHWSSYIHNGIRNSNFQIKMGVFCNFYYNYLKNKKYVTLGKLLWNIWKGEWLNALLRVSFHWGEVACFPVIPDFLL